MNKGQKFEMRQRLKKRSVCVCVCVHMRDHTPSDHHHNFQTGKHADMITGADPRGVKWVASHPPPFTPLYMILQEPVSFLLTMP